VAEDESGEIVGFASGGPERSGDAAYGGELYAIYILLPYQQRGIGRRLSFAVVERLARAGIRSMLIWVLADNPARRFYEALGGREVDRKQVEIGGAVLDEVAYGWSDTGVLADGS
jgi:GNAT superfamily N-acetyltransferase